MTVEDKRNDPRRLALNWSTRVGGMGQPTSVGMSKHYAGGGPEDEAGQVTVTPVQRGRFAFNAEHYQPLNRGSDDAWTEKRGDFVVKSQHRAMIAGEALLRRLQTRSTD